ncbi:MAG TPA: hypothetical protein VFP89_16245 [Propionibacteriaceae bacterium]|nr:hypothetical protein [Propionibacteriaceae bacterium]
MAKLISTLFIAADGVAEIDPDWHFCYFDENMGRAVDEDYDTADVLLIGRETYDSFAGAWPDREAAGGENESFAKQVAARSERKLFDDGDARTTSPWQRRRRSRPESSA